MRQRVLVTGANGFVGREVVALLAGSGVPVRAAMRRPATDLPAGVETVIVDDLSAATEWSRALEGVDSVVHCAARVHQLDDLESDPLAAFRAVNTAATAQLGRAAADAGVRRLVHLSTIGVNGPETFDHPFTAGDSPAPHSPYAVSKLESELALRAIERVSTLEVTVIRPPLVYGPGAPGNFERLLRALHRGLPLPLAAVANRRSYVAVANLADLIGCSLFHAAAAGQTLLVSDGHDLSTPDLLRRTARALGRRAILFPVPPSWLRAAARLAGRAELGVRLCGSLEVDIAATRSRLGWQPSMSVDAALAATARHFLAGAAKAPT